MSNEISQAVRDEVKFWLQAREFFPFQLDKQEDELIELGISCAARAVEITFNKLDLFNTAQFEANHPKNKE